MNNFKLLNLTTEIKWDKSLGRYKLPKKTLPTKSHPDSLTGVFYQILMEEVTSNLYKLFQKIKKGGNIFQLFH